MTTLTRRHFAALAASTLVAPAIARAAQPLVAVEGRAFATTWRVLLPDDAPYADVAERIADALAAIDRQMSPWRTDSDVARFNAASAGTVPMPDATRAVTKTALDIAAASGGALDPTVGPLVSRLGFGPITGEATGWQTLAVEPLGLAKTDAAATLDLCGIAKGHALDHMVEILRDAGLDAGFADLGGEVAAFGHHPDGRPWRAGVEDPRPGATSPIARIDLDGRAVATSGTRWNGYDLGDRRVVHIVDPATRGPADDRLLSVSVLGSTAMEADAWATALMAAGPTHGPALARRQNLDVLFLTAAPEGINRTVTGNTAWN